MDWRDGPAMGSSGRLALRLGLWSNGLRAAPGGQSNTIFCRPERTSQRDKRPFQRCRQPRFGNNNQQEIAQLSKTYAMGSQTDQGIRQSIGKRQHGRPRLWLASFFFLICGLCSGQARQPWNSRGWIGLDWIGLGSRRFRSDNPHNDHSQHHAVRRPAVVRWLCWSVSLCVVVYGWDAMGGKR